jgi:hypothetical protein
LAREEITVSDRRGLIDWERTDNVLAEVQEERRNQDAKWGEQNHTPDHWCVIEMEELGKVARATYEGDAVKARAEWVQVAAVAVAAIESMDRQAGQP